MDEILLFTDGSVDNRSKVGYGAYLLVTNPQYSLQELSKQIKVKHFEQTSSSKLELQTLLWALADIQPLDHKLIVYTDSQTIIGLPDRRERLEQNDFCAKNLRPLNNAQLYREFYRLSDRMNINMIKARGHLPTKQKDETDQLFSLVDKASRQALRKALQEQKP